MEDNQNDNIEISYGITTEEIYNSILSCTVAYDFLDKAKEDTIVIKMGYEDSIEAAMMKCIESISHLVSEIHANVVPQDDGEE